MKFIQYVNCVSPHQLPLACVIAAALGAENFLYVYVERVLAERKVLGWSDAQIPWIVPATPEMRRELESCEILLTGIRDVELFERRTSKGLKTFYQSERWFKPMEIGGLHGLLDCQISGRVRMLHPGYRRIAKRFVRWVQNDPNGRVFAIGPWAKKDMLRLGVPESKIVPWGYFVAPSDQKSNHHSRPFPSTSTLKVLWVGRMLHWKRVDTIIRAVREVGKESLCGQWAVQLTLVGEGPEKGRLQVLAIQTLKHSNTQTIEFLPSQPINKIREIMRAHDVYVLSSNAQEGWGAALNEALEEGMMVIGTYEAGSGATILSDEWLFHAGDWLRLSKLLAQCVEMKAEGALRGQGIGEWSAQKAAERLLGLIA